jgi:hypothetical protein
VRVCAEPAQRRGALAPKQTGAEPAKLRNAPAPGQVLVRERVLVRMVRRRAPRVAQSSALMMAREQERVLALAPGRM